MNIHQLKQKGKFGVGYLHDGIAVIVGNVSMKELIITQEERTKQ